jgi:hypothetical protein
VAVAAVHLTVVRPLQLRAVVLVVVQMSTAQQERQTLAVVEAVAVLYTLVVLLEMAVAVDLELLF